VYLQNALRLDPRLSIAHSNLGLVYSWQGRQDEAMVCFQNALRLDPDDTEAYISLSKIFTNQGRLDEALVCLQEALRIKPDSARAHNNLGIAQMFKGLLDEALASLRETLRLDPDYASAHSNLLFLLSYRSDQDAAELFAEHVRWGERHGRAPAEPVIHGNVPDEGRRLRVGYISADFKNHPVGIFIEQVLAQHDKARFDIFCYSNYAANDDQTARLRQLAGCWRDIVGQPDEVVARLIREDGIDILVDLAGHTAGNRLLTLAHKPAPVQVTWLGYIATTGLRTIDYIIADRFVIPPQDERYYVEQVMRLPNSYLCFSPPRFPIAVSPLPALTRETITFGCFNNVAKLTPRVIAAWAKLLLAVPRSRLFLKSKGFGSEQARTHFQGLFAAHGVPEERLEFAGGSPRNEYVAAYHDVDIGLDPFPYNGGTTTLEALWMGVPVVSLRGDRFVSHVGESILMNTGLAECVVYTEEDYIAKAIELASDLPRLAEMRARLRGQLLNSPLCDGQDFTRDLEAVYRRMWKTWCATQKKGHE
jgi:protein O-GlcNAc transferase